MEMAGLNGLGTAQGNGRLRVRVPVRPMVRFFLFSLVTEGGRGREREGTGVSRPSGPTKEVKSLHCSFSPTLVGYRVHGHHHHHQFLNREGRWGTTDDFATSFLHFSLFSTALWDFANSRSVHSLMLTSHLFLCLPCLLPVHGKAG